MEVKIYNDCKHKFQSWEASVDLGFELMGYGANEKEAKKALVEKIHDCRHELLNVLDSINESN